eukprot:5748790-Pleurochrysis_carterae.AAC.1
MVAAAVIAVEICVAFARHASTCCRLIRLRRPVAHSLITHIGCRRCRRWRCSWRCSNGTLGH